MNEKEIAELRRRFRPEKTSITHIRGCCVNENRVAAVFTAELLHPEMGREVRFAVPGKRVCLQCHCVPPYSRFSSAAMGSM